MHVTSLLGSGGFGEAAANERGLAPTRGIRLAYESGITNITKRQAALSQPTARTPQSLGGISLK